VEAKQEAKQDALDPEDPTQGLDASRSRAFSRWRSCSP
jgi:hypothetical protein